MLFVDTSIYRGILTGYNKAFMIGESTRRQLISDDPKSGDILKPVLRGRDIQRYRARWAGFWLIATHNGYDDVPPVCIDEYPAVKRHLDQFYDKLEKRYDKGNTPYNLRNCAYQAVFDQEKLFWMHMSPTGRFAYSHRESIYCNQKAFVVSGASLKYLCAILNSHLVTWYVTNTAVTTGMGLIQWDKFVVEAIPIPSASTAQRRSVVEMVDRILRVKKTGATPDTTKLENQLDRLIYTRYGLTEQEIGLVSDSTVT